MRWEPIAGIDLKTYARVTAVLLRRGVPASEVGAAVGALGIDATDWTEARAGWSRRIADDDEVREAYSEYYRRFRQRVVERR